MIIIFLLFIFFVFYLLEVTLFNKYWNEKLEIELKFKNNEIFEGESTELIEEITNNKIMPIWWLGLQIYMSRFIEFENEKKSMGKAQESRRKDFFTLLSYERFKKSIKVTALKRGYYIIDEIILSSGDLFNIYKFVENRECKLSLMVYPKLIITPEFNMLLNRVSGEMLTKRHIIDDPFTFRGIRDYTMNDSLKLVNWNATARSGDMKVNQYNYTAAPELLILLNIEKFNDWDSDELIEEGIRIAAGLAASYIEKGVPVGMISNCSDIVSKDEIQIKVKAGTQQISLFLETLARLNCITKTRDMKEIVCNERNKANRAYTIVLISHYYGKDLFEEYELANDTGIDIQWILPKMKYEEINIETADNLILWEVSENERRIF